VLAAWSSCSSRDSGLFPRKPLFAKYDFNIDWVKLKAYIDTFDVIRSDVKHKLAEVLSRMRRIVPI
jgi:hypothetical protein